MFKFDPESSVRRHIAQYSFLHSEKEVYNFFSSRNSAFVIREIYFINNSNFLTCSQNCAWFSSLIRKTIQNFKKNLFIDFLNQLLYYKNIVVYVNVGIVVKTYVFWIIQICMLHQDTNLLLNHTKSNILKQIGYVLL